MSNSSKANFTYFSLGKAVEKEAKLIEIEAKKQTKIIEDTVEKQALQTDQKSISNSFSKDFFSCKS